MSIQDFLTFRRIVNGVGRGTPTDPLVYTKKVGDYTITIKAWYTDDNFDSVSYEVWKDNAFAYGGIHEDWTAMLGVR